MLFGYAVVGYLFLGGLGAGAFFCAAAAFVWDGLFPSEASAACADLLKSGFTVTPVALAGGILLLCLEVGNIDRVWRIMLDPFASVMSLGAWMLALCFVIGVLFLLYQSAARTPNRWVVLSFYVLGGAFAAATMTYTGLLLCSTLAFDVWTSPWLPVLFVCSSLTSGFAASLGLSAMSGALPHGLRFGTPATAVLRLAALLSTLEVAALVVFLADRYLFGGTATASVLDILGGSLAGPFWVFVVGGCFVVPLMVRAICHDSDGYRGSVVASSCLAILAGSCALRYVVVAAGIWTPLVL